MEGSAPRSPGARPACRTDSSLMTSPEAPIEIVSYDPVWPTRFEEEATLLRRQLAPWLVGPIEHIGSTAVPGLAAKPVIDLMAGVQALETSRPAIAAATAIGYCYWPYQADAEHWFCKPSPTFRRATKTDKTTDLPWIVVMETYLRGVASITRGGAPI